MCSVRGAPANIKFKESMRKMFILRIKFVLKIDGEIKSMKVGTSKDISQQAIFHIRHCTVFLYFFFSLSS